MAESGVSKSQLYHYFADKDALVREVIALQTERVLAAQQPHLGALDSLSALQVMAGRDCPAQRWHPRQRVPSGIAGQRTGE